MARGLRGEPAARGDARAGKGVVDDGLAVNGERQRLADADVLEVLGVEVQVDEVDAEGLEGRDHVLDVGIGLVLGKKVRRELAPIDVAVLEGHQLGVVVVEVGHADLVEGGLAVVVVGELHVDDLGGVVVGDDLVLAGADAVGAPAPLLAGGLAGVLREDLGVAEAEVGDEGGHGVGEDEGEVGIVLNGQALELGGSAGEHLGRALDAVVHVGRLGGGCGQEHALEGVLDVAGRQRRAVVELDVLLERAVQGDAVLLKDGHLGEQARDELVLLGPAQKGLEDGVRDVGRAGVRGLLHVQAELRVALAPADDLLLGAVAGIAAIGAAASRERGDGGSGDAALEEVTTRDGVSHCLAFLVWRERNNPRHASTETLFRGYSIRCKV